MSLLKPNSDIIKMCSVIQIFYLSWFGEVAEDFDNTSLLSRTNQVHFRNWGVLVYLCYFVPLVSLCLGQCVS